MRARKELAGPPAAEVDVLATNPSIKRNIERMLRRYKKYQVPLAELRRLLDEDLGPRSLSDEVRRMRED